MKMRYRFDGYLPIVVDIETGGFDPEKDALLEIAAFVIRREEGKFKPGELFHCHVEPFEGSNMDPEALAVNHIDPFHPFRFAIPEIKALEQLFQFVEQELKETQCRRALLVGHNAHFDLSFLQSAYRRSRLKQKNPFHTFTVLDTATLSGLAFGKTVLAKALHAAGIPFDINEAHSAIYDADRTAELFCRILNDFYFSNRKENYRKREENFLKSSSLPRN